MTEPANEPPCGGSLRQLVSTLSKLWGGLKLWLVVLALSACSAWAFGRPAIAVAIAGGGLCAGANFVLSAGWLSRLINRRIGTASFVTILLAKALGLLLLGALMIRLRIAEPFSLGVSFVISTVAIAAVLSFPPGGPSAKV